MLYPVLTTVFRHRNPVLQNEDYFEALEEDSPIVPPPPHEDQEEGTEIDA